MLGYRAGFKPPNRAYVRRGNLQESSGRGKEVGVIEEVFW